MIIPKKIKLNIQSLETKIAKGMVERQSNRPYFAEDDIIYSYEALRTVWKNGKSVRSVCGKFNIPKSTYYEKEDLFVNLGIIGLFPAFDIDTQISDLEALVLLVKRCKPKLSITVIHRIAEAMPTTKQYTTPELISTILDVGRIESKFISIYF